MRPLSREEVADILEKLRDKFDSRPDQVQKRAADEAQWKGLLTKKNSGMSSLKQRAKARFNAMTERLLTD